MFTVFIAQRLSYFYYDDGKIFRHNKKAVMAVMAVMCSALWYNS